MSGIFRESFRHTSANLHNNTRLTLKSDSPAMTFQTTHAFARTDRSRLGVWWWTTDRWLLGATALLVTLGVLLSFASSPAAAARMHIDDQFHFALRQCVFGAA